MDSIGEKFSALQLYLDESKPKIGIVGEIYIRNHPFANRKIINRLEELGVICCLPSLAEWIYYLNFTRTQKALNNFQMYDVIKYKIQNHFQNYFERVLAGPLEKRFGKLTDNSLQHTIKLGSAYIHSSFEGEAILSVGKMVDFYHSGFNGLINIMPFSCMPSTIVNS